MEKERSNDKTPNPSARRFLFGNAVQRRFSDGSEFGFGAFVGH
jgi:hypothetical protein